MANLASEALLGGTYVLEGQTGDRDRTEVNQGLAVVSGRSLAVEDRVQRHLLAEQVEDLAPKPFFWSLPVSLRAASSFS